MLVKPPEMQQYHAVAAARREEYPVLQRRSPMSILVTGGTKGIGLEIALRFSTPGNLVFLNYVADDEAAATASEQVERRGARCILLKQDCGTPDGARHLLGSLAVHTRRLDQLVHCAVRVIPKPLLDTDPCEFTEALNVNGSALLYLTQAALPLLGPGSSIFFITSRGGRIVVPNYAAVGVAKALGEALMRYLCVELAPRGVRINAIGPAMVNTQAVRQVFGTENAAATVQQNAEHNPSGRGIQSSDYAGLIEFLASDAAEFIQGQVIFVNGGQNVMA